MADFVDKKVLEIVREYCEKYNATETDTMTKFYEERYGETRVHEYSMKEKEIIVIIEDLEQEEKMSKLRLTFN